MAPMIAVFFFFCINIQALICAAPSVSIEVDEMTEGNKRKVTTERSPSEQGDGWAPKEKVESAIAALTANIREREMAPFSQRDGLKSESRQPVVKVFSLAATWRNLVVRVMSARSHDFGNAAVNSFYNREVTIAILHNLDM